MRVWVSQWSLRGWEWRVFDQGDPESPSGRVVASGFAPERAEAFVRGEAWIVRRRQSRSAAAVSPAVRDQGDERSYGR